MAAANLVSKFCVTRKLSRTGPARRRYSCCRMPCSSAHSVVSEVATRCPRMHAGWKWRWAGHANMGGSIRARYDGSGWVPIFAVAPQMSVFADRLQYDNWHHRVGVRVCMRDECGRSCCELCVVITSCACVYGRWAHSGYGLIMAQGRGGGGGL